MRTTIKTKNYGEITFFCPVPRGYVWVNLNGEPGVLGNQICSGGHLSGPTLSFCGDDFNKFCRNWWKQYLHNRRGI